MLPDIDRDYIIDIERAEETEMRLAGRVDENQRAIVETLRAYGCAVMILSNVGQGCADLAVGYHSKVVFMEVKSADGKLTEAEKKFMDLWSGSYFVVRSPEDALRAIGITS